MTTKLVEFLAPAMLDHAENIEYDETHILLANVEKMKLKYTLHFTSGEPRLQIHVCKVGDDEWVRQITMTLNAEALKLIATFWKAAHSKILDNQRVYNEQLQARMASDLDRMFTRVSLAKPF